MSWQHDKRWSDRFLPEIKAIVGMHLIGEPAIEDDQERNTDLVVLKVEAQRVGCRVRRRDAFLKFPNEFTIRSGRPSGIKTELSKIIEGWGNYFFYAFCDESERNIAKWTLADLNVFRLHFNRYVCRNQGDVPGIVMPNHDGSSQFRAFMWKEFPPEFVIASGESGLLAHMLSVVGKQ